MYMGVLTDHLNRTLYKLCTKDTYLDGTCNK